MLRGVGTSSFFAADAKARVAAAIAELERQTSAEVVVALRRRSGHYRHTDFLVGGLLALALLCVFLYHPEPFDYTYLPLELLVVFAFGALISAYFPPLRRLLTSRRLMAECVRVAARAAFVDLGISKTRDRTGVLVYLSILERRVEVVTDIGVKEEALGAEWATAKAKLVDALARPGTLDGLLGALQGLTPALAAALPRAADDVNELADEVRA